MKVVTIAQKMSGTGSIYDIASPHYDRQIRFRERCKYAVVLASYYGGKGYTTHTTEEATIKSSNRQRHWSHAIIDSDGNYYVVDYDRLVWIG